MESITLEDEDLALVADRMYYFAIGTACGCVCTTIIGCLIFFCL